MNLLAISSSPRKGGNTDLLLDQLLRGVGDALGDHQCITGRRDHNSTVMIPADSPVSSGHFIEKIHLTGLNIKSCTHCDYCQNDGNCIIKDDMQQFYPKLLAADWLVLASPIYFMAHCAQAKLFIDRCQTFWSRKYILKQHLRTPEQPNRRGIFISVGATHGPKVFAGSKITMKWFFDALDMDYWENLLFEGFDEKGSIKQSPGILAQAYQLGGKIVENL
ncbi:MAG: flavodoxin family protein [Sedimentisphaerales bacterium]|nr:flavodoxin family protein [Sedimentisphaerales bacterium]